MRNFPGAVRRAAVFAMLGLSSLTTAHAADDWTIVRTALAPGGLIPDGAISVSKEVITAVGSTATISSSSSAIGVLLVFGAPCQHSLLAGWEHGRTIPLGDLTSVGAVRRAGRVIKQECKLA
jgi:hypothetical protein